MLACRQAWAWTESVPHYDRLHTIDQASGPLYLECVWLKMSIESISLDHIKLRPQSHQEAMGGWLYRPFGAALAMLAIIGWASLMTWSVSDPSLSFATGTEPRNLLGGPGAILSDLTLQLLGLSAIFAFLPVFVWGAQFALHERVSSLKTKIFLYPLAILFLAGALSALPVVRNWPMNHGLGGIVGDLVLGLSVSLLSIINSDRAMLAAAMLLFGGGLAALFGALGLTQQDLQLLWQRAEGAGKGNKNDNGFKASAIPGAALLAAGGAAIWSSAKARAGSLYGTLNSDRAGVGAAPAMAPGPGFDLRQGAPETAGWHPQMPPELQTGQASAPGLTGAAAAAAVGAPSFHDIPVAAGAVAVDAAAITGGAVGSEEFLADDEDNTPLPRIFRSPQDDDQPSLDFGSSHGSAAQSCGLDRGPSFGQTTELDSRAIAARFAPENAAVSAATAKTVDVGAITDASTAAHTNNVAGAQASTSTRSDAAAPTGFLRGFRPAKKQLSAGSYRRPSLNILKRGASARPGPEYTQSVLRGNARLLEDVLGDFGIKGEIKDIKPGPVVTSFELEPARGTKSSRVIALADDIARSMSAVSARVAVVPGRNAIAIELPNARRDMVMLRDLLESPVYKASGATLPLVLGKSIAGEPVIADLVRMPHLLVAGTTGSGKSVGVNAMILSLLYHLSPRDCRLLLIDPKMLELSVYNDIPHLLTPVVTDPHKAVAALAWAVSEMEERYKRMSQLSVRNIEVFNNRVRNAKKRGEQLARTVQTGFDRSSGQAIYEREEFDMEPMAHIVIVVDEFADLMTVAGKEIETHVQRLAQMARAAGIHLIMATQRPSVDIITGTIKANFPTRISFKVTSKIDSRTILNDQGAEQLLGNGDMLYASGMGQISRVHGPFVSDEEVEQVAGYLRSLGAPDYVHGITETSGDSEGGSNGGADAAKDGDAQKANDDLYDKAVAIVIGDQKATTSYIQRRLSIGYNRAADLIERMEQAGIISAAGPTNKRQILAGAESSSAEKLN